MALHTPHWGLWMLGSSIHQAMSPQLPSTSSPPFLGPWLAGVPLEERRVRA